MIKKLQGSRRNQTIVLPFVFVLLQLISCGVFDQPPPTNQVFFSQKLFADENASPGWVAYGIGLSSWEPSYLANGKLDYFDREVFARAEAAKVWQRMREKGTTKANADLDALWAINESGFMEEYVWVYLKRSSFKDPGDLRLKEFRAWAKENLQQHMPVENPGVSF